MKKETINTFDGGMIKDAHPLTTPKNMLTDALNATLVTYNGNEMLLQNDMGNTEVGTAFLPAGYVPVGMKEYGGIIYVAAWNPETKKGQIGSFPSPKQLWENEGWTVNTVNATMDNVSINTNQFYEGNFIDTETIKAQLFKFTDGTLREFHPGDKYVIAVDSVTNSRLQDYVKKGKIKLQLGVVKSDGAIEIIADAKDDWFLYPKDNDNSTEDVLSSAQQYIIQNKVRVFNGSSSGSMIIIINIVTLDSFDLMRKYSLKSDGNTVNVQFIGKGTRGRDVFISDPSNTDLKLYYSNSSLSQVNIEGTNQKKSYTIYPQLDWGIVKRMKKSGSIDFAKIKKSEGDFHEWRFFVTDDYVKLGWAYEFYNLNDSETIEGIQMDFYDFMDSPEDENEFQSPKGTILLQKDAYSGNFEDYIRFDQNSWLKYGNIYVVRISRKKADNTTKTIVYKMLYVSEFYNEHYNTLYDGEVDLSTCIELKAPTNTLNASVKFNTSFNCSKDEQTKVDITTPSTSRTGILLNQVRNNYYISNGSSSGEYVSKIINNYNGTIKIDAEYVMPKKGIIGIPSPAKLTQILSGLSFTFTTKNNIQWVSTTTSPVFSSTYDNSPVVSSINQQASQVGGSSLIKNISFSEYRYVQGTSSPVLHDTYEINDYLPVLDVTKDFERQRKTLDCYDYENPVFLSGARKDGFYYNSTIGPDGNIIPGPEGGAGFDDTGLNTVASMANSSYISTVHVFAARNGKNAELIYNRGNSVARQDIGGWGTSEGYAQYIDDSDDWMVAVWKFSDGFSRFVNLFSKRTWKADVNQDWPRVDIMLRCFLSQIFIAQKSTMTTEYKTTNEEQYRYQDGKVTIVPTVTSSNVNGNNIMQDSNGTKLTEHYNNWKNWISTQNPGLEASFTNLLPTVDISTPSGVDLDELEITEDSGVSEILKYYLGNNKADRLTNDIDLTKIKILDISKDNTAFCKTNNGRIITNPNGAFEWTGTPNLKDAGPMASSWKNDTKDTLYDWKGGNWKMNISLYRMFITRAAKEQWTSLREDNELLGNYEEGNKANYIVAPTTDPNSIYGKWWIYGKWTENRNLDAPDLWFNVLNSNKSLYQLVST